MTALYILQYTALALIDVLDLALFVRAILSWFDPEEEFSVSRFLFAITEPVIIPIRILCSKFHWFEESPMDVPFIITWLILALLRITINLL